MDLLVDLKIVVRIQICLKNSYQIIYVCDTPLFMDKFLFQFEKTCSTHHSGTDSKTTFSSINMRYKLLVMEFTTLKLVTYA
jgi:hypothetical protein